jgi:hypothetical protein
MTAFATAYSPLAFVLSIIAPFLLVHLEDWITEIPFWVSVLNLAVMVVRFIVALIVG